MAMNGTGMMGNGNSNPLSPRAESIGYWAEGLSHGTHENPPTFVSEEPLTAKTNGTGMIGEMMDVRMSSASMANLNMGLSGMRAMSIGDALTEVSFANRGPNVDKLRKGASFFLFRPCAKALHSDGIFCDSLLSLIQCVFPSAVKVRFLS